jgi:hypothetical protein
MTGLLNNKLIKGMLYDVPGHTADGTTGGIG